MIRYWLFLTALPAIQSAALACAVSPPPFNPNDAAIDRIVVGRVGIADASFGIVMDVAVEKTILGRTGAKSLRLIGPGAPFFICRSGGSLMRSGDRAVVYFVSRGSERTIEAWMLLDQAVLADSRVATAFPTVLRKVQEKARSERLAEVRKYGGAIPRWNRNNWVTVEDYPSRALRNGAQGIVGLKATVDDRGFVESCIIVRSSGSDLLDEATCKNYSRRARFKAPLIPEERTSTFEYRWMLPPSLGEGG